MKLGTYPWAAHGHMDTTVFFLKGLVVGFVIAAPVGPVGILCIRRTLALGKLAGYTTGLGATMADTIFGFVAAFGLGFIAAELAGLQEMFRAFGSALLCLIGAMTLFDRRVSTPATPMRGNVITNFASAFLITITNPITFVSFAGIFAAIGIPDITDDLTRGVLLIGGVFIGAGAWWSFLTTLAGLFRVRVTDVTIRYINRVSGILILAFGIILLATVMGANIEMFGYRL